MSNLCSTFKQGYREPYLLFNAHEDITHTHWCLLQHKVPFSGSWDRTVRKCGNAAADLRLGRYIPTSKHFPLAFPRFQSYGLFLILSSNEQSITDCTSWGYTLYVMIFRLPLEDHSSIIGSRTNPVISMTCNTSARSSSRFLVIMNLKKLSLHFFAILSLMLGVMVFGNLVAILDIFSFFCLSVPTRYIPKAHYYRHHLKSFWSHWGVPLRNVFSLVFQTFPPSIKTRSSSHFLDSTMRYLISICISLLCDYISIILYSHSTERPALLHWLSRLSSLRSWILRLR